MNLIQALNWRYAAKRMNGNPVPQSQVDRILDAVRLAPSSYGLQPYSVLVIADRSLRERIRPIAFGQPQITQHTIYWSLPPGIRSRRPMSTSWSASLQRPATCSRRIWSAMEA